MTVFQGWFDLWILSSFFLLFYLRVLVVGLFFVPDIFLFGVGGSDFLPCYFYFMFFVSLARRDYSSNPTTIPSSSLLEKLGLTKILGAGQRILGGYAWQLLF